MRNKSKFRLWLLAAISFMGIIFFQSSMPYQQQNIRPLLEKEIRLTKDTLPAVHFKYDKHVVTSKNPYGFIEFIIRKLGHVIEYAILTILWIKTFQQTHLRFSSILAASFLLSMSYALLDEWHQATVNGRTGHLIDVLIPDLFGVLIIVGFFILKGLLARIANE